MKKVVFLVGGISLLMQNVFADPALLKQRNAQQFINQMVKEHHMDKQMLIQSLKAAKYQPQIIESMNRPFEQKKWDVYRGLFLTPERLNAGLAFWQKNRLALSAAEKQYGVPASMIVAIIGIETLYGKHQGNYRVLDALSTLAFYYPKRSPYFTRELAEFFLLCQEHHVSPVDYYGSYAGAMGKPQFMPSSYRAYAVKTAQQGHPNLMESDQDAIISVANYFHKHGWNTNQPVAKPAQTKHGKGVEAFSTTSGAEYWTVYPNFNVIKRYNSSPQYALVAYLFASQLQYQWAQLQKNTSTL